MILLLCFAAPFMPLFMVAILDLIEAITKRINRE